MKNIFLNIILTINLSNLYAQSILQNSFQAVSVPDRVSARLERSYNKGQKSANAGKNVYNLVNRKDYVFKDGIFSFQGQGPHFPRRLFIYNKNTLYIFNSEGAFNPKGVLHEFSLAISQLHLSDQQVVVYCGAVSLYLSQEFGHAYGGEIK